MALRGASTVTTETGDYIDWVGLAAESAAVVITVKGFEESKDWGNGPVIPVRARVIVLTGTKAGEVYEDESIIKKGITIKLVKIGDDVVGRIKPYGTRKHPGLEQEHDGDIELAERALAKFGGGATVPAQNNGKAAADDTEPPF